MTDYTAYLQEFMERFDYPGEAIASLMADYAALHRDAACGSQFDALVRLFDRDLLHNYLGALEAVTACAEQCRVPWQSAQFLFALCLTRHTEVLYRLRGISPEIYRDSMLDLRYKLWECQKLYGVWGSFVSRWFERFFRLTRFALGRLQFETDLARHDISIRGHRIRPGDPVVKIHIPSCGPLSMDACQDSFRRAANFFAPLFPQGPAVFYCNSWLLFPEHTAILPEDSNIRKFMDFFHIAESYVNQDSKDLWRIFCREDCSDPGLLPQDTGLQRAYVRLLLEGKQAGGGIGYFLMENGVLRN